MIIRKVRLEPFAGFSCLSYEFKPGLNVVFGPNEAGKSTLVNAIHAVLFIPPGVKRNSRDWKELISRYLPCPHGDTARVMLEFSESGKSSPLTLHRTWGAKREGRLVLDKGVEISEEIGIERQLDKLLRHGRGTYEQVFLARQAGLIETLDQIKQNPEALNSLADMLRALVFQSGGISVEALEHRLRQKITELESNWDVKRDAPRGGRDVDNRHQRNVGRILEQYYRVRILQQELALAEKAEKTFETMLQQFQEIEFGYKNVVNKEKVMNSLENDMSRRNALEPKLETLALRQEQLKAIIPDWPRKKERVKGLMKNRGILENERISLAKELTLSQKEQEIKKKREVYHNARQLKMELERKQEKLDRLAPVTPDKLGALEKLVRELSGLKAEIGGMKLKIKLKTETAVQVMVTPGLEEEKILLVEGEKIFEARGQLGLKTTDWSIEVQSGIKNVEILLKKVEKLETELGEELEHLGLPDIQKAREIRQKAGILEEAIRTLSKRIHDALQGHLFANLEVELAAAGEAKAVRDPIEISQESSAKEHALKNLDREMLQLKEQVENWQAKYGDFESLLEKVVELKGKGKTVEEELAKLAPLPAEYSSADAFLNELRQLREKKENIWERLLSCRENKIRAESNMPEESPEEIKSALQVATRKLKEFKAEAAALRVVEREFSLLKEELDANTFDPFQKLFLEYLFPLTGQHYRHARMSGALPEGIAFEDGQEPLPFELLSHGTISGVALALRLAMARYLLKGDTGFLVMDDPLVDLDPERKKQAAQILRKAAENKQIIITTCDPHTATLLGGHTINLGEGGRHPAG